MNQSLIIISMSLLSLVSNETKASFQFDEPNLNNFPRYKVNPPSEAAKPAESWSKPIPRASSPAIKIMEEESDGEDDLPKSGK